MKKIIVGSFVAATMSIASLAMAADLPRREAAPAPAPAFSPSPTFNWTGFYAGVNGGLDTGSFSRGGKAAFGSATGGAFGATLGYNYQIGQFVTGIEGDYDFQSFKARKQIGTAAYSAKVGALGTIRGRLGYAVDRSLLYVTGGYAFGSTSFAVNDPAIPYAAKDNGIRGGYALGAGIEYAFTNNISAKGEYLYTSLSPKTEFGPSIDNVKAGANISNIRLGLNYKF